MYLFVQASLYIANKQTKALEWRWETAQQIKCIVYCFSKADSAVLKQFSQLMCWEEEEKEKKQKGKRIKTKQQQQNQEKDKKRKKTPKKDQRKNNPKLVDNETKQKQTTTKQN